MSCQPRDSGAALLLLPALVLAAGSLRAGDPRADFEQSFAAPVVKNCLGCHNPTDAKGGLDLTHKESLLRGGKSGPVVLPGKPDESYLLQRIADGSMPPPRRGTRLSAPEVAVVGAWIKAGANWPAGRVLSSFELTTDRRAGLDWWSLQPVRRVVPPELRSVEDGQFLTTPIDAFVLAKLREHGLAPVAEADRRTYLRRAKFDLLGLPPTPEEMDAFVTDRSPNAYEKLLDRLLASPHYGERWGRHWLDVVRFGESDGFENDKLRDHAWRYRDYIIRSFNQDKPYPRFVEEQLAGDVLEPVTHAGIAATGFLVAGPWDEVQNVAKSPTERRRAREEQMEELVGAVGQTFLGLTVHCARCHDHKFDPIPQADYYRLKAVFDGVDHGNRPLLTPAELKAYETRTVPLRARIDQLKAMLARAAAGLVSGRLDDTALVEGRFGRALDARRGRFAEESRPELQGPPLTVECWAKLDGKRGFNILVANNVKESADHWELYTYAGRGDFSAYLPGYAPAEVRSGRDVADGKWHYFAMSFDGHRVRLFVDGRPVTEAAVTRLRPGGAPGLLYFGAYPPQQLGCDGLVDEVRISRGLRRIDRVPTAPFVADGETLGLWHFDAPAAGRSGTPAPDKGKLQAELTAAEAELARLQAPLAYSGTRRRPEPTVVYLRGDIHKPGPRVTAGGLSPVRSPAPDWGLAADADEGRRRRRFARWLVHPDNPLPARVLVNRIWQHHFGQGLVPTPSDLGFHGGRPSHPELLDWLARQFIADGWSVKQLHRRIMLSAAYRRSAAFDPRAAAVDADNRFLWRFAPRRLEAEAVRDSMLAVSGALNPQLGGPSFRPFTVTVRLHNFYQPLDRDTPECNRRTVYRMNVNTGKSPFLDSLDCPAPSLAMPRRRHTTTPAQALALMNDTFVQRQAELFARRVAAEAAEPGEQVALAYRLALGRRPTGEERAEGTALLREYGLVNVCWVLLNASEFLYVR